VHSYPILQPNAHFFPIRVITNTLPYVPSAHPGDVLYAAKAAYGQQAILQAARQEKSSRLARCSIVFISVRVFTLFPTFSEDTKLHHQA